MKQRQTTQHCGILALDKPAGITSHDVVDIVRRATGERRVGHAGTLDPLATGLILVCVGPATRLSNYLINHDKGYIARIVFGAATDTDDSEGRIVSVYSSCAPGTGLHALDNCNPQEILNNLLGESMQLPPAYSAIKKNGVVAYKAAREGKNLDLQARPIRIDEASLVDTGAVKVDLDDGEGGRFQAELPYWDVALSVSKGTYIRSVARDLGQSLDCGAHIGRLRRVKCCNVCVEDALSLRELVKITEAGASLPWLDPAKLLGYQRFELSEQQSIDISNGKNIYLDNIDDSFKHFSCTYNGKLLAVCEKYENALKPVTVIPGGVCGVA